MRVQLRALLRRWNQLSPRVRTAAGIAIVVVVYGIARIATGGDGVVQDKVPYGIVLLGVVTGTVNSLLAIGLILIYRSNRFVNFAYGAMGSLIGVLAIGLFLQHDWPYFLVLPLGVIAGVIVGALTEFLVIRRFRESSRLILTVASIGLAQLLGGLELLGSQGIGFTSLVGGFSDKIPIDFSRPIDVVTFRGDQVLIVAIVPLVIAGLAWFLLKTDAGIAVRAAAENSDRALLAGIPIRRLSTIVWMIAGGLATLTYILKAPFTGIALGIMEQVVRWNSAGTPSFQNVVFLVVIIGALLLQKGSLSRAKAGITSSWSATGVVKPTPLALRNLPEVRFAKVGLVVLVAAAMIFVPQGWSASTQLTAAFAIIWAMVGVSLVVLTGWGGNISLGQFGIVGVGAIVAGNLVAKTELDLFIALLLAGLAGAAVALVVGLPALRISGLFLAVTTLAFAVALNSFFFNPDQFGSLLPNNVVRPFLWERFDLESNYAMYLFCLAFLALSVLAAMGVRKARAGRVVIGARDNQRAADAAAVPTTNVKLSAFILSGVIAGIAGGLHVLCLHALGQNTYSPVDSLTVFCTAVIGGLGSLGGAILGVLIFRWLETITALGDLRLLITGTGLLVVLYALPGGFGQLMLNLRDRYLRWVANRHDILVPTLVADKRTDDDEGEHHAPKEAAMLEGALSDEVSEEAAQEADDLLGAGR